MMRHTMYGTCTYVQYGVHTLACLHEISSIAVQPPSQRLPTPPQYGTPHCSRLQLLKSSLQYTQRTESRTASLEVLTLAVHNVFDCTSTELYSVTHSVFMFLLEGDFDDPPSDEPGAHLLFSHCV
jgi:hypothetical protein